MSKKEKSPRPEDLPPKGMKYNPYFQLPYAVIDVALVNKLTAGALRCLLLAMKADRGNRKKLKLGIDRTSTGTRSGRNAVIKGLDQLVGCGLLVEVNDRGDYRLGAMFDKYIPDESVALNDIVGDDDSPSHSTPESNAEKLLIVWNDRVSESQKEPELDEIGKERAEDWARARIKAGTDPVEDFEAALDNFITDGHKVPLEGGKPRDPGQYHFAGFLKVLPMFLKRARASKVKESAPEPYTPPDTNTSASTPQPVHGDGTDAGQIEDPDISQKYSSFILGKDKEGKFIYREGKIASAEELAWVFEHAFSRVGVPVDMGRGKAVGKCIEDFQGMLAGKSVRQVLHMVAAAKAISKTEAQQEYFSQHSFTYHTARTLFGEALQDVMMRDAQRAASAAKYKNELESGELREKHFNSIRNCLSSIAWDYRATEMHDGIRTYRISDLYQSITGLIEDYGNPTLGELPQDIIDGLRFFSAIGSITIPENLSSAVGIGPYEPTFDWIKEQDLQIAVEEVWRKESGGAEANTVGPEKPQ